LMLLPQLIRKAFPDALIGFFLHIPFPSYEIFRLIPTEWKRSLLTGLLGADLIGFHTHDYVQYFIQSVKMVLGLDNTYNTIHYQHRLVKADLFPIGIDYAKFRDATNDKEIISIRDEIRKNFSNKKIIFSVDRLDYSKGLMDRLQGFECFLERFPEWKERVVFIVNVVPSRDSIQTYNDRKRLIEEKISIINGLNATLSWQPVIYRYNHLEFKELSALYQAADVALITPLRDGMNLVAKEYVASCTSQRGVLILSELAGAASELSEAILVNPTDVMEVSSAIQKALTMPLTEQRYRMILMQKRLMDYDVFHWVNDFFEQLNLIKAEQRKMKVKVLDSETEEILRKHYTQAKKRCILLDYDGTLSPFTRLPADAIPGADLKTLLLELASDPKNNVVVISGRDADTLERWLGKFPVSLVAEHGAQVKLNGEGWKNRISITDNWKEEIRPLLEFFVTRCAGSFIEEKRTTLAWHYRNTQPDLGFTRSRELLNSLNQLTQNTPLQIIDGNKVMEIRLTGIDKGITALSIVDQLKPDFVLCMGDDTTDEDMFKALENKGYTIKIGNGSTAAQYNILSQDKVLPLLYSLITPKTELKQEWTSSS
jgi:trehalose 6-phosphate synthase/phosphatase